MGSDEGIEDWTVPMSYRTLHDPTICFQGSNTEEMETRRGEFK